MKVKMPRVARSGGLSIAFALLAIALPGCASDGSSQKVVVRPPPTEVRGGRFALVAIGGQPPETERPMELTFSADGQVSGFGGVNQISGPFEMTPEGNNRGKLRFGALVSTRMAGPEKMMQQEKQYLDSLRMADGYIAEGGLLELTAGGQPILRYRALGAASPAAGGR